MRFTYYNVRYLTNHMDLPGIEKLLPYFRIYSRILAPVDRTDILKFPVKMKSLFPLPEMRAFTKSYEEICDERAQELLKRAEDLDTALYVFWSGGIDSTCVLVSLLKNATNAQKERIVVLMTEESITEYPAFYLQYVRGKLRRAPAMLFPHLLGTKNIIITGEHNDQLFGSDIVADVAMLFGFDAINQPYDRKLFTTLFETKLKGDGDTALFYARLFERLCEGAPISLTTNHDYFWWINFAVKWQTVYMRMLNFVAKRNVRALSENIEYYQPFYNTEDFQLWSMNNRDQRVRDGWRSYKWPAKEVIFNFTKDAIYRDSKVKRWSLQFLIENQIQFNFIDEDFKFHESVAPKEFYEGANDFI